MKAYPQPTTESVDSGIDTVLSLSLTTGAVSLGCLSVWDHLKRFCGFQPLNHETQKRERWKVSYGMEPCGVGNGG